MKQSLWFLVIVIGLSGCATSLDGDRYRSIDPTFDLFQFFDGLKLFVAFFTMLPILDTKMHLQICAFKYKTSANARLVRRHESTGLKPCSRHPVIR